MAESSGKVTTKADHINSRTIVLIQTGGTIDKDYPKGTGGYAFDISDHPASARILDRLPVHYSIIARGEGGIQLTQTPPSPRVAAGEEGETSEFRYAVDGVLRKDSQEITEADRQTLANECRALHRLGYRRIVITHGTDTMIRTARYLAELSQQTLSELEGLVVVVTGARQPERLKDSDADFNVGMAIGAAQCLSADGGIAVYIAMSGQVIPAEKAARTADGKFIRED
ncbi:hypothetical protein BV898_03735 [Hypsibius exemplaris]|uniref:L-asparaginase N-terminal domain-containing protein n=1 Tax=Hypsibius exemplaris TaxID=2072580 RepID=A0A1W0X426_HYPEX|nr:hypothetical protein BV898_03735 [Hypsibius exemplaris]